MFVTKIDVSRRNHDVLRDAVLVIRSREKLMPRDALSRFRRSVSQWLANTDEGKKSWEASGHGFNYGDYEADRVANCASFNKILNANGLEKAVVKTEAEDCGESWDSTFIPEGS